MMFSQSAARQFAIQWIGDWNSHDLEAILSHYSSDVVLTSPAAAELLADPAGTVNGRAALRRYFEQGLAAYPNLTFQLLEVMRGVDSVVLCFINQKGTQTAEYMEFDASQKIVRVVANYA
jgi:ketosteroid isomerase-like protein